jgi:single-strand DNA-binding protein
MNILTFVGRLGRDAEVRDANGTPVANLALAYNYGRKGQDNKQPSQWVEAALWGQRAEGLAPYHVKGQQFAVVVKDVHIHLYTKADGTAGSSLRGDVLEISFAGPPPQQQDDQGVGQRSQGGAQQRTQGNGNRQGGNSQGGGYADRGNSTRPQRPAARAPAPAASSGFDDMDDDIPF